MGETLNILFRTRAEGGFAVEVRDSWSGKSVSGDFIPPFTPRSLTALLKRLDRQEIDGQGQREIGERLFAALCGKHPGASGRAGAGLNGAHEQSESVGGLLHSVIQRTLRRRGTVALTLSFTPGCDEFIPYPWELLHNGEYFLVATGVFTLTRILLRPDGPGGCELPVHPPLRVLYIGATPVDCEPLETERSYDALRRSLALLIENGQLILDRLEPCTFSELVRYLNAYGGAGILDDSEVQIPCYVVHFDGHGDYGRVCPREECGAFNEPDQKRCRVCGTSLARVSAQTYLCFCDEQGKHCYIDTHSLRELLVTSDVRLVVLAACETARLERERSRQRQVALDNSLATALVTAQIPAVVAMPFSLQDNLSPVFIYHFYEALARGRTLEEALSRARHALLSPHHSGWFIPVLYRHASPGCEEPVPLLVQEEEAEERDLFLANFPVPTCFVGRERELSELTQLITAAAQAKEELPNLRGQQPRSRLRQIVLTGPVGIGKSALAFEVARRNRDKFPGSGGVIGISLQGGKTFAEAIVEMAQAFPGLASRLLIIPDLRQRARYLLNALHARSDRELPCLLLIDGFEEVTDQTESKLWLRFLGELPERVVVLLTSRSHPATLGLQEGAAWRWYEYPLGKMTDEDLLRLFSVLAAQSGLDKRIHLDDPVQQEILREICVLLDGYPLGAELIFGAARSIGGKVFTPEAATRSLEEIRDELRETPLAGIWAALEVAYLRLSPAARLLLSYLSAFRLPFSTNQIVMLIAPHSAEKPPLPLSLMGPTVSAEVSKDNECTAGRLQSAGALVPEELAANWRAARDELVQASFMGFDGRVYSIHPQVRNFALSYLPAEERRRVHRVVASYYLGLPHLSPEEWFAAFEHLVGAGELEEAVRTAVRASWALCGRGYASQLLAILRRAGSYAVRIEDKTGEGQIQCCLGAILRQLGNYTEAVACLKRSLQLHQEQHQQAEAAWTFYELAMLACDEGNLSQAADYAAQALAGFEHEGNRKGTAWALLVQGEISRRAGRYREALACCRSALAELRATDDQEGCAWALLQCCRNWLALANYSEAQAACQESQRLFASLGLRIGSAWALAQQALLSLEKAHLDDADQASALALEIFQEQGMRPGEGLALCIRGGVRRALGDWGSARSFYEKALTIFTGLGNRADQAQVLTALGALALAEGALHEAGEYFEQALSLAQEQEARPLTVQALRGLGDTARLLRAFSEARAYYEQALELATELGAPLEISAVHQGLGELARALGQLSNAQQHWTKALLTDQRLEHPARRALQQRLESLLTEQTDLTEQTESLPGGAPLIIADGKPDPASEAS
ncbi:tetratricopeptide repeat protein [Thermogemmatispora sp.]|uniref:tetratricopeptide repeat protein n=1 Tax=Thermogemmatispora sp. TaxID=1968838 RepID=UPI001DC2EAA7|nr:tetratricopeptide repeat protein [Thermogemmatispora sp.]MBX5450732.1 tetratricopeptide repeat protein [Thermogemmatispora sp.]